MYLSTIHKVNAMSLASLFGIGEVTEQPLTGVNLVDFSQLVISTITATFKPEDKLDVDIIRHLTLNTIRSNVSKNKKDYPTIVIAIDNAKIGYWRRDVAYYYKKNRAKSRDKSAMDWETIFEAMHLVTEELKENMPYHVISKDKTEADDVIAVLTKHISTKHPQCKILITSSDGDFTQLHKFPKVKQWSPIQKKWVVCKHGSPRNDLRYKIVKGDGKDGISSIKTRSDYKITKLDGERAPMISTIKFLNPLLEASNPYELLSGDELARYKENEVLLDFELIPEYISSPIIDQFENVKPAPRRNLYPYFVSKRLVKLIDHINDF